MNEIYWGKIIKDGFHYRLPDDTLNNIVLEVVLGNVKPVPWVKEAPSSHIYYTIENGNLFATRLITSILSDDLEQILNQEFMPTETKEISGYRSFEPYRLDLIKLTYDLHLPVAYTGSIVANQIFVDKTRYPNGVAHKDTSTFAFVNGCLDTTASIILKSQKTTFEDTERIWSDDIPARLASQPTHPMDRCRRYYVDPIGNMRQNDYIIDVVCSYKASVRVNDSVLNWIFSHDEPVLRTHLKIETAPGSCVFKDWVYDLVAEATKVEDKELLDKLTSHKTPQEEL